MLTGHVQSLAMKLELPPIGGIGCLNGHSGQICTTIQTLDPCSFKSKHLVYSSLLPVRGIPCLQFWIRRADRNVHILAPLL